jgi:hypothetical protein
MSDQLPSGFPSSLLEQSIAARRLYFETKVVAHQRLKQVYEDLLHAIRYPAGTSLIFVTGPTGVGKTTLLGRIVKQVIEDAARDPTTTGGHIPVVAMEAPSSDSGNFSWKDYVTRALIALDEPMMASKITSNIRGIHRDNQGQLVIERSLTTPDLRRVLEKCMHYRRLRAFIVDEAQHLKKMASGRRLLDQMDTLKSLANMTKTSHVLIGHYDLLGLMDLSAQLSSRSVEIHLPRYRLDKAEDLKEFKKLLRTFQRHLPLLKEPDLQSHADYFYERSLGCTGLLKKMLNKAYGAALEQGEQTLTPKLWERHAEPPGKLKEMLHEILTGERRMKEREEEKHLDALRAMLGKAVTQRSGSDAPGLPNPATTVPQQRSPRRSVGRVGQRSPARDPVGKESDDA